MVLDIQRFSVHDGPGIRTLVFLKGCPLRCRWCANPESVNFKPELGLIRAECNSCGACVPACPRAAVSLDEDRKPVIDRELCDNCGKCIDVCFPHALIMYGRLRSAQDVFEEVKRDMPFYAASGGGMTVSGGEPLSQPEFVKALFTLAHEAGIHTAVETAGCVPPAVFKEILPLADYVLFDLKCFDPQLHRDLCGRDNRLILANARALAASGLPFIFRIPVIPGCTDSPENISAIADFVKEIKPGGCTVELMPYHRLGTLKYEYLGRKYSLQEAAPPGKAELEALKSILEIRGITVI